MLPVLLRWLLALLVMRRMGRAAGQLIPGPLSLWLRDIFAFAVWAASFFVSHVDWRGQRIALAGPKRGGGPAMAQESGS